MIPEKHLANDIEKQPSPKWTPEIDLPSLLAIKTFIQYRISKSGDKSCSANK